MLPGGDVGGTIMNLQADRGFGLNQGVLPLILITYYKLICFALQIGRLRIEVEIGTKSLPGNIQLYRKYPLRVLYVLYG